MFKSFFILNQIFFIPINQSKFVLMFVKSKNVYKISHLRPFGCKIYFCLQNKMPFTVMLYHATHVSILGLEKLVKSGIEFRMKFLEHNAVIWCGRKIRIPQINTCRLFNVIKFWIWNHECLLLDFNFHWSLFTWSFKLIRLIASVFVLCAP